MTNIFDVHEQVIKFNLRILHEHEHDVNYIFFVKCSSDINDLIFMTNLLILY